MTSYDPLNILVGVDLSEMDGYLIQYLNILDKILNIKKVTFLHNIKLGELPVELVSADKIAIIKTKIQKKLSQQITTAQASYSFDIQVSIDEYSEIAFSDLYRQCKFDLLVLGNKQQLEGNGALSHKLVRLLPSATLLVPETFKVPIKTIIDAIDFSKYTPVIMDWAYRFQNNSKGQKIKHSAVHISKFSWIFYPSLTDQEIEQITNDDIEMKKNKWSKRYAHYADIEIISAEDKGIPTALLRYAEKKRANLMILGVKGTSTMKEIFLGSVANQLFERPTNTCLLFVKG